VFLGQANGPCLAQVQAAAGTTDPNVINQQFQNPSTPLGRAVNLVICRSTSCSDECAVPRRTQL
jgi:hypothetical protein